MKPKKCPFNENCQYDEPEEGLCEGNYEKCAFYSWNKHKDTIPLPLICPFIFECQHQTKTQSCSFDAKEQYDYRNCEVFSKWFWHTKAEHK